MPQDVIKIKHHEMPNLTRLRFYESRDGGDHWMFNGQLMFDREIAAKLLKSYRLNEDMIVEEDMED